MQAIGDLTGLGSRGRGHEATVAQFLDLFFGDDDFRVQFERTPASTGGHHAKIGGFLLHAYEVTSIARQSARTMRANVDLVVADSLLHDIGKLESCEIHDSVAPRGARVWQPVLPITTEAAIVDWADEPSAKATDMADLLGGNESFAEGRAISGQVALASRAPDLAVDSTPRPEIGGVEGVDPSDLPGTIHFA